MEEELILIRTESETPSDKREFLDIEVYGQRYSMYPYHGTLKIIKTEGGNLTIQPSSDNAIKLI